MYIDDWPTQATRSLWHTMMQDEDHRTLKKVLGNDRPTLAEATKRFQTWIKKKRIRVPNYTDPKLMLDREMIDCALDEVDWEVITFRIAVVLEVPICKVYDFLYCPKCYGSICQLCMLCINPKCKNGHERGCLSEAIVYPLGPILFDFTDRKLVVRIGEYEMPISREEYKRFYTWLDIRKNG